MKDSVKYTAFDMIKKHGKEKALSKIGEDIALFKKEKLGAVNRWTTQIEFLKSVKNYIQTR